MSTRGALTVVAAIVLGVGVLLALLPVSVSGGVGCGSAVSPDSKEASAAEFGSAIRDAYAGGDGSADGGYQALCEDRVTTQRLTAFPIAGVGALGLVFLALTAASKAASEPLERSDQ